MEITANSVDGLLLELYKVILQTNGRNEGGTRGPCREILGVTLRLTNVRARLSRSENRGKPFSAIGELLWYLSGSDKLEHIKDYVPEYVKEAEGEILQGAYGPRLFRMRGINQFENVLNLLTNKPSSKRAVIQLFNAEDLEGQKKEIPCTTTLQFHRRDKLHMSVTMRSNDAYLGLPHDLFCFTMIQELVARYLGVEVGEYIHHAGSMHAYDTHIEGVERYVDAGYHKLDAMPSMPSGDHFSTTIPNLIKAENKIRGGEWIDACDYCADDYWSDIVRMVQAFWASGDADKLGKLLEQVNDQVYLKYIRRRVSSKSRTFPAGINNDV